MISSRRPRMKTRSNAQDAGRIWRLTEAKPLAAHRRGDKVKRISLTRTCVVCATWLLVCISPAAAETADPGARLERVLRDTPLIDGHNDLTSLIRERFNGDLNAID